MSTMEAIEPHHILFYIAVIFMIAEIFTAAFVSGSISIGFVLAAIANYFDASISTQIVLFTIGVFVGFFTIKGLIDRYGYTEEIDLNTMVGAKGYIIDNYLVEMNGERWKYECPEKLQPKDRVEVTELSGLILTVKKLN